MSKQNFLNTLKDIKDETVDASQATPSFTESTKQSISTLAERAKQNPERQRKFAETAQLVGGVISGRYPSYMLQEAMTTSDFPLLFGDVMDRLLLAGYRHAPATFEMYMRTGQVRDFRAVQRHYVDGGDGVLDPVKEQAEYPTAKLDDGKYSYSVSKFGRRIPFSWETLINDDLDAFADVPERLGRGARRSEEKFATSLFVSANGPNAQFFASKNNNVIEGNPKLSHEAIEKGFTQASKMKDPKTKEPILNRPKFLVVPPELEIKAKSIVNALEIRYTEGDQQRITNNWMRNDLQIVVNHYIPIVAKDANSSPWFLIADPNEGRGFAEFGRLRGHTDPAIFMKRPNAQPVGGGSSDPMQGDFDTDSIEYKVRHVFGGGLMSPLYAMSSDGSGS